MVDAPVKCLGCGKIMRLSEAMNCCFKSNEEVNTLTIGWHRCKICWSENGFPCCIKKKIEVLGKEEAEQFEKEQANGTRV